MTPPDDNADRAALAQAYQKGLANLPGLVLPNVLKHCDPVWHLYVVLHPERDRLAGHLKAKGIETLVHYPIAPHMQEAYVSLGIKPVTLPIAELLHQRVLSLPIWPGMTSSQIEFVIMKLSHLGKS